MIQTLLALGLVTVFAVSVVPLQMRALQMAQQCFDRSVAAFETKY